ncbi:Bacterial extracellular solute-binding protein [Rubrobacter radiotolerans]|uniref:ABC transporter substrate-binding protein n=1 Tax=Rubrobacter radiotolerans TaxID=42256 RepID=A0A023X3M2_RUBRA|nr:ABC transporter substrate-binding protein [Rubrobacter radiotolerans]AHY47052.1 Bacterial extracellular solute-binding protein [Rubrobacter radiotolerans]MDX5894458.1 ABC transporter substrate-binding protein [Rubrobacter radiotolerans]SMC06048.1 carbohydrate ABC transporter substrate-binding protein, CUT1 family [Rubrobacter radiotolerans DSM 5868]
MRRIAKGGYGRVFGRGMSRRRFLQLGGASLAGATLLGTAAGCGGGGSETADDGSLIINFAFGPDASGTLQQLVQRFNEEFAGEYQANFQEQPADTGQFFDRLRTQFQAGGGDLALIGGDVIWPGQFAANGWILDLSDRFTEDMRSRFLPGPIESNTYEGAVYGVPWFTDFGVLYYRSDLLDEAGVSEPPATWQELQDLALQISEDTGTQFGFAFQGANYEGGVVNGLEYIYSHGGQILSEDSSEVLVNSPEAIAGLTTQRQMVESGAAPQAVANYTEMESHTTFLNGNSVFLRNWPYVYGLIPDESQIERDQVGVATLPAGEGGQPSPGLGGWNFYINATANEDVQEGAWAFIEFASQPEQQKFRAIEGGFLPTLSALYEDQEVLDALPVVEQAGGLEAIQNATPRPTSPYYSDMSLVMAEQFNANVTGNATPEQVAQRTQEELQSIIDQGGAA